MKRVAALVLVLAMAPAPALAQERRDEPFQVLVYSRTAGFRHASIQSGVGAIQQLGQAHGFEVEASEDPAVFAPARLEPFEVVVFLNTTGDVVPAEGQAAFEEWLRGGGGWVGIHSAADTEYDWEFYGQLLGGAYFANHPLLNQDAVLVIEDPQHPSTTHLPTRWRVTQEEFYSFRRNPRGSVHVLVHIDESTYLQAPNTSSLPNSPQFPFASGRMGDHPMAWCHTIDRGNAWYTAIGHAAHLYSEGDYRQHLLGGILTVAGRFESTCSTGAGDPAPPYPPGPDAGDPSTTAPPGSAGAAPTGAPRLPATGAGLSLLAACLLACALGLRRRT